jgi:hypothetical protein
MRFQPGFLKAGGGAPLLLDTYPNATFAWSFRKLRNAYAGSAVRIREDGGDTEADIGFGANGDFDAAAAASHIGAANGFITTFYDQSGGGKNLTNATASLQPEYSATAYNGFPGIVFPNTSGHQLGRTDNGGNYSNPSTITWAYAWHSGTDDNEPWFWEDHLGLVTNTGDIQWAFTTDNISPVKPVNWTGNPHIMMMYKDSGDVMDVEVDGVALGSEGTKTTSLPTANNSLSYCGNKFGINGVGSSSECVIWFPDRGSSDRAGIVANLNAYYGVF